MTRSVQLSTDRGVRPITHEPTITSTANPKVAAAARLASRKGRRDEGAFLVEGPQAVGEGLDRLRELFATPDAVDTHTEMLRRAVDRGVDLRVVTPEVLRVLADTVTPQGVVGVAPVPQPSLPDLLEHATFLVVLDGISDPGNAGAIIRSADAAGADGVVFLRGAVDPYNPKAVRASTGSIFHLPVLTGVEADQLSLIADAGLQLLAADVHASVALDSQDLTRPTALVFGGEAAGVSSGVLARCSVSVHLPIARPSRPGHTGHAESLNLAAAAAVMAYAVHGARASA